MKEKDNITCSVHHVYCSCVVQSNDKKRYEELRKGLRTMAKMHGWIMRCIEDKDMDGVGAKRLHDEGFRVLSSPGRLYFHATGEGHTPEEAVKAAEAISREVHDILERKLGIKLGFELKSMWVHTATKIEASDNAVKK